MADPIIKRGPLRSVTGVEVDTLSLTLGISPDVTVQGQPIAVFARAGGFDGARVSVVRHFSRGWEQASCGSLPQFAGRVSDLPEITGTKIQMEVRSDLELLNVAMPRNLYMAPCGHQLYGPGCNLSAAAFTEVGQATGNSTARLVNCNLPQAAGYFDLGTVKFTTGANAGITRSIRTHTSGVIVPSFPFPYAPAAGDLLQAKPGCDKLRPTCSSKFSNLVNFRGFVRIPAPELSY
jgi:uncharacterized phage protein (TIGR02218 family)